MHDGLQKNQWIIENNAQNDMIEKYIDMTNIWILGHYTKKIH